MSRFTTEEDTDWSGNNITKIFRDGKRVGTATKRKAALSEQLFGEEDELTELRDNEGHLVLTSRVRNNNSLFAALGFSEDKYLDVDYVQKDDSSEEELVPEEENQTNWLNPQNAAEEEIVANLHRAIEKKANSFGIFDLISIIWPLAVLGTIIYFGYKIFS